jgi:hypothetical protein
MATFRLPCLGGGRATAPPVVICVALPGGSFGSRRRAAAPGPFASGAKVTVRAHRSDPLVTPREALPLDTIRKR